jgi:hypothetical protein
MTSRLLERGITLWKSGQKNQARGIFKAVIYNEHDNETAWFWYIYSLESSQEKISALETFLSIVPTNEKAQLALKNLRGGEQKVKVNEKIQNLTAPVNTNSSEGEYGLNSETIKTSGQAKHRQYAQTPQGKSKSFAIIPWGIVVFGMVCLLCGFITSYVNYNNLKADYQAEKQARQQLSQDYASLNVNYQAIETEYNKTIQRYNTLVANHSKLQNTYNALQTSYVSLKTSYDSLQANYDSSLQSYEALKDIAITPPYIYIRGREVHLSFLTPDQRTYNWPVSFDSLEYDLRRGNIERNRIDMDENYPRLDLRNTTNGESYHIIDYRRFVDPSEFESFSPYFYGQASSEYDFVYAMWYIVAQLTSYSNEITDTPRYPFETLLAGGGDCEDHAILLASIILAAAPPSWEVDLVYMDSKNPTAPQTMNHVIVFVDTGNRTYTIEATGKDVMEPYEQGVRGWYSEIDH